MNKNWDLLSLGKLLKRRKDEIYISELEKYKRITIKSNGQGIVIRDRSLGNKIGTKKQFIARHGQLVMSKIDARNGAFGILPEDCNNSIITGNFWAFDIDKSLLDSKYFNYLTKTPLFVEFCIKASDGTTNRRYLQEDKFLSMKISLPPLEEQRRIVSKVEELAGKIEEARSLREQTIKNTKSFVTSLHLSLSGSRIVKLDKILNLDEHRETVEFGKEYPQVGVRGFGGGLFAKESINTTQTSYRTHLRSFAKTN